MEECFLLRLCEDRVANSPKIWREPGRTIDLEAIGRWLARECPECTGADKQRILERRRGVTS